MSTCVALRCWRLLKKAVCWQSDWRNGARERRNRERTSPVLAGFREGGLESAFFVWSETEESRARALAGVGGRESELKRAEVPLG